jgi:DNA mismatch repair ATPase MutS
MQLVRARLRTSIDITDALERGLSLFMAELLRIRAIVEAARAASDCRLFFLADEMLRGTNAVDRHSAIVTIMTSLIDASAVGAVATHDSTLATDDRLRAHLRLVHFVEQFRDEGAGASAMWFDYRLRPGLSTSRNALKLLELVGLTEPRDRS